MLKVDKKKIFNGEFYLFLFSTVLIFATVFLNLELNYYLPFIAFIELLLVLIFIYIYLNVRKTYIKYKEISNKRFYIIPEIILVLITYILLFVFNFFNISRVYLIINILVNLIYYLIKLIIFLSGFITHKKEVENKLDYTFFLKYLYIDKNTDSLLGGLVYLAFYFLLVLSIFSIVVFMFLTLSSFNVVLNLIFNGIYLLLLCILFIYIYRRKKSKFLLISFCIELIYLIFLSLYFYLFSLNGSTIYDLTYNEINLFIFSIFIYYISNFLIGALLIVKKIEIKKDELNNISTF